MRFELGFIIITFKAMQSLYRGEIAEVSLSERYHGLKKGDRFFWMHAQFEGIARVVEKKAGGNFLVESCGQ